jgi:hypothetical protein
MSKKNANGIGIPTHLFVIRLRALVLALGESSKPAWWKTEFMNETGLRFLERLYPRTPIRAAVHAAGRAACEAHDQAVGRVGVYHLFRLPEVLEAEMHAVTSSDDEAFFSNFRSCLGRHESLLELIAPFCGGEKLRSVVSGPKRIDVELNETMLDGLSKAAAVYREAFKQGKPTFPYFVLERNRING